MTRVLDQDFGSLVDFLTAYDLSGAVKDPAQLQLLKAAHKAYLPFLQLWSICLHLAKQKQFQHFGQEVGSGSLFFAHLLEAVSDIGSGLFCCVHGAYKPGQMALRSSIENFLRFSAGPFDSATLKTTSVYDLFGIAKKTVPFASPRDKYLHALRSEYVDLCKFSHSASLTHMAGVQALAHFPSFDSAQFEAWISAANACMRAMARTMLFGQPKLYLGAHFQAKELLDQLIAPTERVALFKRSGK